jgi:hypothetical protein
LLAEALPKVQYEELLLEALPEVIGSEKQYDTVLDRFKSIPWHANTAPPLHSPDTTFLFT